MIGTVVRSEGDHFIPVKYSRDEPGSISTAPILRCPISSCSFARRARRSSAEIGLALDVRDLSAVSERAAASDPSGAEHNRGNRAATCNTERLDSIAQRYCSMGA